MWALQGWRKTDACMLSTQEWAYPEFPDSQRTSVTSVPRRQEAVLQEILVPFILFPFMPVKEKAGEQIQGRRRQKSYLEGSQSVAIEGG